MGSAFWDAVGGKLAERWAAVAAPALGFWLGGILAFMLGRGGFQALAPFSGWLDKHSSAVQAAVLVAVLFGVAGSGVVVSRLAGPVLAIMEGYWPKPLWPLRQRLADRIAGRAGTARDRFQVLVPLVQGGKATPEQREEYARIDRQWRRLPTRARIQPTRVGNTLRAAETRPIDKYGLDAAAVWPHLWLLLPQAARDELAAARRSLDTAVEASIWGLLFVAFTPWTLWALPAGLAVMAAAALAWVPARAEVFADLVEAAFDLHHDLLYRQLRWPLPANPADDRTNGRRLTTYLMRGLSGDSPAFTDGAGARAAEPETGPAPAS
ncbi:MAG TPA: hypothetical protein VFV73_16770 [Streptosporangiaceae bacterium]|nr:hypothetical protein [Streptosporangiaceae bacterium]